MLLFSRATVSTDLLLQGVGRFPKDLHLFINISVNSPSSPMDCGKLELRIWYSSTHLWEDTVQVRLGLMQREFNPFSLALLSTFTLAAP